MSAPSIKEKSINKIVISLILILPIIWLFYCAIVMTVEWYDGLDTICNTAYFTGNRIFFLPGRAPFISLLLIPADIISRWINLPKSCLVPYHLTTATLHSVYLLILYYILSKNFGKTIAVAISFTSAILCFVFFSYSILLSHDIVPGLLFLLMLMSTEKLNNKFKWRTWGLLVLYGSIAVLIKQTYGIFWFIIGTISLINIITSDKDQRTKKTINLMIIIGAGCLAFLIYWTSMAAILKDTYPAIDFLIRPYKQIRFKMSSYEGTGIYFPLWIYTRNMLFYGSLTVALIIPGLIKGFKSKGFSRNLSIAWILGYILIHCFHMREVRYIAFLMPLSAFLIIPVIQDIIDNKRKYLVLVILLLTVDVGFSLFEASRVLVSNFYTDGQFWKFISPLKNESKKLDVICNKNNFVAVSPWYSPFAADRYHRLFHVSIVHKVYFIDNKVSRVDNFENIKRLAAYMKKGYFMYVNKEIANSFSFAHSTPVGIGNIFQVLTKVEGMPLKSTKIGWSSGNILLRTRLIKIDNHQAVAIQTSGDLFGKNIFPSMIKEGSNIIYPLTPVAPNLFVIEGINDPSILESERGKWSLWSFKPLSYSVFDKINGGTKVYISQSEI